MAKIEEALAQLDDLLRTKNPTLSRALASGASVTNISKVEKAIGAKLPAEVASWWRWHNGTSDSTSFGPDANWYAISVDEAVDSWKFLGDPTEEIQQPWKKTWLPLFANGAGDYICVDAASGALVEYRHDDAKRPAFAKSLAAWVDKVSKAYAKAKPPQGLSPPVALTLDRAWTPITRIPNEPQVAKRAIGCVVRQKIRWQRVAGQPPVESWEIYGKVGPDLWCHGAGLELDKALVNLNDKLTKPFKYGWPLHDLDIPLSLKHAREFKEASEVAETQATMKSR
jgi:cell wall assembly regulator SMI1